MRFFSPAKINLFLRVVGKREDGYHELSSLFQAVSLGDEITLLPSSQDAFLVFPSLVPADASNLVLKAVALFRKETKWVQPLHITLQKRIPPEAGLGGGSSNAATTLWALNTLCPTPLPLEKLILLGSQLGSDVPFFFSAGRAHVTGRGEHMTPLSPPTLNPPPLWLVKPPQGLSTALIFSRYTHTHPWDPLALLKEHQRGTGTFLNDLEKTAFEVLPLLKEMKHTLLEQGCEQVFLTGSGTGLICTSAHKPQLLSDFFIAPLAFHFRSNQEWYPFP